MQWNYVKLTLIGIIVGLLAGVVGAGAYAIIISGLITLNVMNDYKLAIGTSLVALLPPVGILAAYNHYANGNVNIVYALYLAAMIIIGTYVSSFWEIDINNNIVKKIYAIFLILLGVIIMFEHKYNPK